MFSPTRRVVKSALTAVSAGPRLPAPAGLPPPSPLRCGVRARAPAEGDLHPPGAAEPEATLGPRHPFVNGHTAGGLGTPEGVGLGAGRTVQGSLTKYMESVEPLVRVTLFGRVLSLLHPQELTSAIYRRDAPIFCVLSRA